MWVPRVPAVPAVPGSNQSQRAAGFQGLVCLGTSISAPLLLGDLLGSVRQGRLNVVPPLIEVKYVLKYPLDPKSEIRVIQ